MMAAGYSLARDIGALQPRALDWARHSPHLLGEGKCRCESIAYAAKQRSLSDHTASADSRPIFNAASPADAVRRLSRFKQRAEVRRSTGQVPPGHRTNEISCIVPASRHKHTC